MDDDKKGDERLCASCDRCRSRKTKCDGNRPCSNCAAKYMKKHKLNSIEGIDVEAFECIYSPAKRRGPIPGRQGQVRKIGEVHSSDSVSQNDSDVMEPTGNVGNLLATGNNLLSNDSAAWCSFIGQTVPRGTGCVGVENGGASLGMQHRQMNVFQQMQGHVMGDETREIEPLARRIKLDDLQSSQTRGSVPRTITTHMHLLERSDSEGARLYSFYKLSIDELYCLPATPTDEEFCQRSKNHITPNMIPGPHLAALSAGRFAELALGALVHNEVSLAMELCNAVVHCLRESVREPVQTPIIFEVAKAYFLLGVFRACRGDMTRYFKYRRVSTTYLAKLETDAGTATLLAAISFLDSWAYMIYNANEKIIPDVNGTIPPICNSMGGVCDNSNGINAPASVLSVLSNPQNQNWIQGAPCVYLNNEAPLHARSIDALACAVRQCCDQANQRFKQMQKNQTNDDSADFIPDSAIFTPTSTVVMAHENELCSRNMVLSAYTLMQQHEAQFKGKNRSEGHHMIISAMDAFLENSEEEGNSGFTDSQIQSLLAVCNTAVENPLLLHHAGPTYHMVTNSAVLLCHLLNGMHAMKQSGQFGPMEAAMFDEVLDTYIAVRKLLTIHRRRLPVKLRCHALPRPNLAAFSAGSNDSSDPLISAPFVDLGETLLCACRGCQGFVLMACSPCVAAERARDATKRKDAEVVQEAQMADLGELDQELDGLNAEFEVDDDALLSMISSLIQNY